MVTKRWWSVFLFMRSIIRLSNVKIIIALIIFILYLYYINNIFPLTICIKQR